MSKNEKVNSAVNSRNSGEKTFGHGSADPKALGPQGGNDKKTKKTQINLRPADADKHFASGQHNGEEK